MVVVFSSIGLECQGGLVEVASDENDGKDDMRLTKPHLKNDLVAIPWPPNV